MGQSHSSNFVTNMLHMIKKLWTLFFGLLCIQAQAQTVNVISDITTNTTWTSNNVYVLYGDIFVKNGATLTIQPGTIIRGDRTTLSRLVITTSGMIDAQGTADQPIVFTSNQPAGSRARADWAGIAILGTAPINTRDAGNNPIQKRLECGTTTDYDYGGSDAADNSGILRYVRIEYAGYVCGTNTELNSLTLGGVGSATQIDHVMVSYGQDDGIEIFGGTVNLDHVVSFATRDDDIDTDDGWVGKLNHALIVRIDTIADQGDVSNAFESDNDPNGTANTPLTGGVISNVTVVGPAQYLTSNIDPKFGWIARLRRNTSQSIFNSLFIGYKRGLRIEGTGAQANANSNALEFKSNLIAGTKETYAETAFDTAYLLNAANACRIMGGNANDSARLRSPYGNPLSLDFRPMMSSPALTGSNFSYPKLSSFTPTTYVGAFGQFPEQSNDWANGWTSFNPQAEVYTSGPLNYGFTASLQVTGGTAGTGGVRMICPGDSIVLTASSSLASPTFEWSNGSNASSITVSTAGSHWVIVRDGRGTRKSIIQQVGWYPAPATPVITPSASVLCSGEQITLTSSVANAYVWSVGNQSTRSITVSSGATYALTTTDANGCKASDTLLLSEVVPVTPAIVASGPTSFCTGSSVELNVTQPASFTSFSWNTGEITDSILVTQTDTLFVITVDLNGCSDTSNTILTNVSASPTPTITANGPIVFCEGGTVQLTSTIGDSYLWSNGATTPSITVDSSSVYSVVVTNSDVCLGVGTSNQITVNVLDVPVAGFTTATLSNGYTIGFTNTSSSAVSYNWNFGNGNSSTQSNPDSVVYAQNGQYTITLIARNSSGSVNCADTTTQTITVIGVGVEEVANQLSNPVVYPNPNSGRFNVNFQSSSNARVEVRMTDLTGRAVFQTSMDAFEGMNHLAVELNEIQAGIYLIYLETEGNKLVFRMMINR